MKEFEAVFSEGLSKGLRRDNYGERDKERLTECFNVMPMENGVKLYEALDDLNAAGVVWGGRGQDLSSLGTTTITVNVTDYITGTDIESVSVYIDDVYKGRTDANGDLEIVGIELGGHSIKMKATGYTDSDEDELLNDYILVT